MRPGWGSARRWTSVAVGLLVGAAVGGCGIVDPGDEAPATLAEARARWEARGFDDYTLEVRISCFCPPETAGPFRVVVADGRRVRVERVDGGEVQPEVAVDVPDVEGLFTRIEEALARDAHRVEARYDPTLGSPVYVSLDLDPQVVDEEVVYLAEPPVRVP